MRSLTTTLVAILAALAITACSGGSSSSSADNSGSTSAATSDNSTSSATSDNSGSTSSDNSGGSSSATTANIPSYPGATTMAEGSTGAMSGMKSAAGKVMSTGDSFDKVYAWYQKNMPAGSEKSHMTTPVQSAVFMIGDVGKDQQSVTITTQGGKTMITVAHVKM